MQCMFLWFSRSAVTDAFFVLWGSRSVVTDAFFVLWGSVFQLD